MRMSDELMVQMAETIVSCTELSGEVRMDVEGGFITAGYRKGADLTGNDDGTCSMSGAWCDIAGVMFHSLNGEIHEKMECDVEAIENMVAELINEI